MSWNGRQQSGVVFPIADNSESTRLAFWRQHSQPIPTPLLQITGWIDEDPDREVYVQVGREVVKGTAKSKPANVLFRLPDDPRGRSEFTYVLTWLRREQARRSMVKKHLDRAELAAQEARAMLQGRWDELYAIDTLARDAGRRARLSLPGALAELRTFVEQARAEASRWRIARRHSQDADLQVRSWTRKSVAPVYPGINATINAFLDVQALRVATVSSGEFMRRPNRPSTRSTPSPPANLEELPANAP
ncbi:MAG: hypothetical protein L3K07_03845 [Thermoplasmata archaeon]|nr:hypothetical protein [Thermoplasmata archaeon]